MIEDFVIEQKRKNVPTNLQVYSQGFLACHSSGTCHQYHITTIPIAIITKNINTIITTF